MKLYLVRHGEAMNVQDNPSRPLSEQGQLEVQVLARFVHQNDVTVHQIYHSDKLRAVETAKYLAESMSPVPNSEILPGLQPDDPVQPIAEYCNHWHQDVMLVGHLPFMPRLASELLLERDDQFCIDFQTAAMVCLERVTIFQWCLKWFVAPALLDHLE
jgi:phosphohistidine phosphatase